GYIPGDCAMTSPLLWTLIAVQLVLGLFDIVYHHEMMERLAWRTSQRRELKLHGARNLAYAVLFLGLGLFELKGVWAMLVIAVLAAEIIITLIDFVEEDLSRKLPARARHPHAAGHQLWRHPHATRSRSCRLGKPADRDRADVAWHRQRACPAGGSRRDRVRLARLLRGAPGAASRPRQCGRAGQGATGQAMRADHPCNWVHRPPDHRG